MNTNNLTSLDILLMWIRISLFGLHHSIFLLQLWKYNVSQAVNELGCQTEVTTDHMWLSSLGWQSGLTWLTLPGQKKQSNYHLLTEAANMEPRYDWHCDWGVESGEWRVDQRDDLTRSVYKSENYAGTWLTTYVMCMFSFSIELEYYNIIPSLCLNYIKCNLSEWLLYYGLLQSTNKPLISTLYIIWYFVCLNSRYIVFT